MILCTSFNLKLKKIHLRLSICLISWEVCPLASDLAHQNLNTLAHLSKKSNYDFVDQLNICLFQDGVINDLDDAVEQLIKSSELPLSVLVIGVGPSEVPMMVCWTTS